MARIGDVEVYRSGIGSLLEAARQEEAAFNDPLVQAMKFGTQVSESLQTAMVLEPKREAFMEGLRGKQEPFQSDELYSRITSKAIGDVGGDAIQNIAKERLGDAYSADMKYKMDAQGNIVPDFDLNMNISGIGTQSMEERFKLKTPDTRNMTEIKKQADANYNRLAKFEYIPGASQDLTYRKGNNEYTLLNPDSITGNTNAIMRPVYDPEAAFRREFESTGKESGLGPAYLRGGAAYLYEYFSTPYYIKAGFNTREEYDAARARGEI